MSKEFKVSQLVPADGWYAAYALPSSPYLQLSRLVAFVNVEHRDGSTGIDGIDRELSLCMLGRTELEPNTSKWKMPHFMGFHHEADLTPEMRDRLLDQAKTYQR